MCRPIFNREDIDRATQSKGAVCSDCSGPAGVLYRWYPGSGKASVFVCEGCFMKRVYSTFRLPNSCIGSIGATRLVNEGAASKVTLEDKDGQPVLTLEAKHKGDWKDDAKQ